MCPDDQINDDSRNAAGDTPTESTISPESNPEPTEKTGWSRRTFLKAAALGTAAAAIAGRTPGGSFRLGSFTASANDLSTSPCTAQDVTVAHVAHVVNEPCTCSGTFEADVTFSVTNHTGSDRYCVTLHIPDGFGVPAQDVVLGDVPAGQTKNLTGTVSGFPCNAPQGGVCFGAPGTDGRFKCTPNTCLTVAWNTSANQPCPDTTPPGGQCRHQQVCVEGYGAALECANSDCSSTDSSYCSVECGADLYLNATAFGASSDGDPTEGYTFTVTDEDGNTVASAPAGSTSPQCFTISDPASGDYKLTVTDSANCDRTAIVTVEVASITANLDYAPADADNPCNGVLTFTGSVTGCSGTPTFQFSTDGGTNWVNGSGTNGDEFTYVPPFSSDTGLDTGCKTVMVKASCGSCTDTTSLSVTQCVSTTSCTPT